MKGQPCQVLPSNEESSLLVFFDIRYTYIFDHNPTAPLYYIEVPFSCLIRGENFDLIPPSGLIGQDCRKQS